MVRRIYIVSDKHRKTIGSKVRAEAKAHNCSEVCLGIPASLKNQLSDAELPCIHEEPETPIVEIKEVVYMDELEGIITASSAIQRDNLAAAIKPLSDRITALSRDLISEVDKLKANQIEMQTTIDELVAAKEEAVK